MICLSKRHEKKETTKTKEVIVPVVGSLIPASHVLLPWHCSRLTLVSWQSLLLIRVLLILEHTLEYYEG